MHCITGLGRSGTSFIAEILQNLGFEMGKYEEHVDAGFEHPEVTAINKAILSGDFWNNGSEIEKMRSLSQSLRVAKDPRWIMTLGVWVNNGCKIDSVIICRRDYQEILRSTEKSFAGTMAIFHGWSDYHRMRLMETLEAGIMDLCSRHGIRFSTIMFPESLVYFSSIMPLKNIVTCEEKLRSAWEKTVRRPSC